MTVWVLLGIFIFTIVTLVAAVYLGRRLASRWHQGTGREQWLQTAQSLSWRQRGAIVLAQGLGRPVRDPKLVEAAIIRGQYALAVGERMQQPRSPMRRTRWLMAAVGLMQVLNGAVQIAVGHEVLGWVVVGGGVLLGGVWLFMPGLQRRDLGRIQRSVNGTRQVAQGTA